MREGGRGGKERGRVEGREGGKKGGKAGGREGGRQWERGWRDVEKAFHQQLSARILQTGRGGLCTCFGSKLLHCLQSQTVSQCQVARETGCTHPPVGKGQ